MRQAIHIFKKDARHMWVDAALLLALVAAFAFSSATALKQPDPEQVPDQLIAAERISGFFLVVMMLLLPGRLVRAEALLGDRQFWLTRPYSRASLLGAKYLFLCVFVLAPMTLSDMVLLRANGFEVSQSLAGLMWEQALRAMVMLAPGLALAAITRGAVSQILTAASLAMGYAWVSAVWFGRSVGGWTPLEWVDNAATVAVIFVASAAVVVWQYARRREWAARIGFAAGAGAVTLVPLISPGAALAVENLGSSRVIDPSAIHVEFDRDAPVLQPEPSQGESRPFQPGQIPLRVRGVPEGYRLWADQVRVESDRAIMPDMPTTENEWWPVDDSHALLAGMVPDVLLRRGGKIQDHLRVTALMTLARNTREAKPEEIGCRTREDTECRLPYRGARVVILTHEFFYSPGFYLPSSSPFPADLTMEPSVKIVYKSSPGAEWPKVEDPVQRFFYRFELDEFQLTEYRPYWAGQR